METLYRKVEIKSEQDLPKEKDKYFVKLKHGIRTICNFHSRNHKIWLERVDWYLQVVEPEEEPKHPTSWRDFTMTDDEPKETAELGRLKFSDVKKIIKMVDENDVIGNHGVVYEVVCIALEEYAQTQQPEISVTEEKILEILKNIDVYYDAACKCQIDGRKTAKKLYSLFANSSGEKVTDQDIEKWAIVECKEGNKPPYSENEQFFINGLVRGLMHGAKAMRDGKIKQNGQSK